MKRGDIVTVAAPGDNGKPRPAMVIQSDLLVGNGSILVCQLTTVERDAPLHRVAAEPAELTGLRQRSQIMVEKIVAVPRAKCGATFGRLDSRTLIALNRTLAPVVGLVD